MKDFIKRNIVLFVILGLSLLFFLTLAFLSFLEWNKVANYQASLIELQAKVQKLNDERPYPLKENLDNIKKDTEMFLEKVAEINSFFGKPYQSALKEFLKVLNKEDAKKNFEFTTEWSDYFRKNFKKNESPEKFLNDFLATRYSEEDIKEAKKAFVDAIKTKTVEPITESNLGSIILDALSVPRTLSPDACKVYMLMMEEQLTKFAKSPQFGNPITFDEKSKIFKVYDDVATLPPADFIPHIIKHYRLIEDLVFRMKASGVDSIKNLQKLNGLEGTRDGQYLVFIYQADIIASSDSLRSFFENLIKAKNDNRIYVIKSLSITKNVDEVKNKLETKSVVETDLSGKTGAVKVGTATTTSATSSERFTLGTNDKINAEIKFAYIIYVGDEIKTR